jgi:hypothetical protein
VCVCVCVYVCVCVCVCVCVKERGRESASFLDKRKHMRRSLSLRMLTYALTYADVC